MRHEDAGSLVQHSVTNKLRGKHSAEAKQKISETLHLKRKPLNCKICGNTFYRGEGYNTSRKFCSYECKQYYCEHIHEFVDIKSRTEKVNNTKRKNHTCNISTEEDIAYDLLKSKYPNIIRQYRSEQYPYNCDFYIPDNDLYIEYNGSWTHGDHFYTDSAEDRLIIQKWKDKHTKYYDLAVYVWTDLDVRKYITAQKYNLNYKVFWNLDEVIDYIKIFNKKQTF